jgi:hypothetical protein
MKTKQLRIRLSPQIAAQFEALPPRARGQAVSLVLAAWVSGLDLGELVKIRRVVVNTGNLLNQSLRTSWGRTVDAEAATQLVRLLRRVVQ